MFTPFGHLTVYACLYHYILFYHIYIQNIHFSFTAGSSVLYLHENTLNAIHSACTLCINPKVCLFGGCMLSICGYEQLCVRLRVSRGFENLCVNPELACC